MRFPKIRGAPGKDTGGPAPAKDDNEAMQFLTDRLAGGAGPIQRRVAAPGGPLVAIIEAAIRLFSPYDVIGFLSNSILLERRSFVCVLLFLICAGERLAW